MKLEQRAKIYGVIGTILFHIVFLLLLWFLVMLRIVPDEEEGLAVRLGTGGGGDGGSSDFFEPVPAYEAPDLPLPPVLAPLSSGEEELQTQNVEESVSLPDSRKKKSEEEIRREQELRTQQQQQELVRQEELRKIAEARAQQEAQDRRAQEIGNQARNVFGGNGAGGSGGSSSSSGQGGGGQGSGTPGNPFGSPDATGTEGSGKGTGSSSYSLAGRELNGALVRPSYSVYEEGKIVVNIIVDKDGAVINAEVGSGTNLDNPTLRNAAKEAARKTKFNKITADKNQSGTITYLFKLQ
jgi:TonB family protein